MMERQETSDLLADPQVKSISTGTPISFLRNPSTEIRVEVSLRCTSFVVIDSDVFVCCSGIMPCLHVKTNRLSASCPTFLLQAFLYSLDLRTVALGVIWNCPGAGDTSMEVI